MHGLDNKSSEEVKVELKARGYSCEDVKVITKSYARYVDTIYVISFANGTVKLRDLRANIPSLFRTIVRWELQRKLKNKPVQCRNCQMYGQGEKNCFVRSNCSNCSGKHKTADCITPDQNKCANCRGNHKSTDTTCPNREAYLCIREAVNSRNNRNTAKFERVQSHTYDPLSFPTLPSGKNIAPVWPSRSITDEQKSNLFSQKEITDLTIDVVSKLKKCNSKEDQFNVITQLAIKYLYSSCY